MAKSALYKETADDPLGNKLYLTSYRVMRHAEQILIDFDLTFHSYLALYYIDRIPRISMKDLCEYIDVSQSIISRTVSNLESKGLLKKAISSDRRKSELALTSEARKKLRKASGKLHELSFIIRHQPNFRISETDLQLDLISKGVSVAKDHPILRNTSSSEPGESVIVRLTKRVSSAI
ncbi:MarR family transcriptional regulator [Candidatus Saccharibacteria bacterium]|nr:MarR family transcriptional regulator [Candidatus Saccharibacteria bacterium]